MSLARKLQIKPGRSVALLRVPDGVSVDVPPEDLVDSAAEADVVMLNALLSERGVRGVRQVAVDETWSALRFRPVT